MRIKSILRKLGTVKRLNRFYLLLLMFTLVRVLHLMSILLLLLMILIYLLLKEKVYENAQPILLKNM